VLSLLEDILPFVAAFYLAESFAFVIPGEWLLIAGAREFRLKGEGLHLAAFWPWARTLSVFEPGWRPGSEGLVLGVSPLGDRLIPWHAVSRLTGDRSALVLARDLRLGTPSPQEARILQGRLLRLASASNRLEELEKIQTERHDISDLRRRLEVVGRGARPLRVVQSLLFAVVFVVMPLRVAGLVPIPPAWSLVAGALLWLAALLLGFRLLRALGTSWGDAASALSGAVLFPPAAMHLSALLERSALAGASPLAAAALLLPQPDLIRHARERQRRLERDQDAADSARLELQQLARVVQSRGLELDDVREPPVASEPGVASYCPLCSQEYRPGFGTCAECRVTLEPLAER